MFNSRAILCFEKQLYKLNVEREVNYFLLFELTTIIVIREKKGITIIDN
jgi:hypothetical protein